MQAVLYVSHGSRVEKTRAEVARVVEETHRDVDVPCFELCYLEIASPTITQGAERLIEKGAETITIVPMLLFRAGHYYSDIPEEITGLQEKYPEVTFTYGEPLGLQESLIDALTERIREREDASDFLLVARGSRDPETKGTMEKIRKHLEVKTGGKRGKVCYLAVCEPSFEQGLAEAVKRSPEGLIVVPCLWFTGRLIHHIEKEVTAYQEEAVNVQTAHYLDNHPYIIRALRHRVQEALKKEPFTSRPGEGDAHELSSTQR